MSQKIRNSIKYTFVFTLVLLFGFITYSNSYFYHAHILENGKIIRHSHPYQKSSDSAPFKHHHHSSAQLSLIDHAHLFFFQLQQYNLPCYTGNLIKWKAVQLDFDICVHSISSDRAPPTTLFL